MVAGAMSITIDQAWEALRGVPDPEVPALSVVDLGIIRAIEQTADGIRVDVTPTYSGCPALDVIEREIGRALEAAGAGSVVVRRVFAPAWSTDMMSDTGRQRLKAYGIAPPGPVVVEPLVSLGPTVRRVECPFCGSADTEVKSEFGPTACKALYVCHACRQPFEHFKAF
jgi:ring-1,2-phenylacetyl-CoA epoxidase subunit PaaD